MGWSWCPSTTAPGSSTAPFDTLKSRLTEEFIIVALVCALFLWHLRSALVVILSLPIAILAAFMSCSGRE